MFSWLPWNSHYGDLVSDSQRSSCLCFWSAGTAYPTSSQLLKIWNAFTGKFLILQLCIDPNFNLVCVYTYVSLYIHTCMYISNACVYACVMSVYMCHIHVCVTHRLEVKDLFSPWCRSAGRVGFVFPEVFLPSPQSWVLAGLWVEVLGQSSTTSCPT